MKVPGSAWVALVILLTGALGGWLTEYIQQPYVPIIVMALSLIAKAVEIYFNSKKEEAAIAAGALSPYAAEKKHSKFFTLLFG